MRKFLFSLFCLSLLFPITPSFSEGELPFVGRVTGNRVNVRVGSNANTAVVTQLNKGKLVLVLEEDDAFFFIEPPEGTTFWIYSRLVRDGWPKSDDVNVRSGPGTHYPIVCQVDKNTSLDIVEEKEKWIRIRPPQGSTAKINKDYVVYFSTPENYAAKLEEEKISQEQFKEIEAFRRVELNKSMMEINFDLLLGKYQNLLDQFPGSPLTDKIEARIKDTQSKKEVAERELRAQEMRRKRAAVRIPKKSDPQSTTKVIQTTKKPKVVKKNPEAVLLSFEGLLRPIRKQSNFQFTHQLQGGFLNTRRLCLLSAPQINLSSYHNKKVRVWGQFVNADNEGLSGIRVERIELAR